jgi:hypothetical protein
LNAQRLEVSSEERQALIAITGRLRARGGAHHAGDDDESGGDRSEVRSHKCPSEAMIVSRRQ